MARAIAPIPALPRKQGRECIASISRLPSPRAAGRGVGGEGR
jgi:hypothetical protein